MLQFFCVGSRVSTSLRYEYGSCPFRRADWTKLITAAERWVAFLGAEKASAGAFQSYKLLCSRKNYCNSHARNRFTLAYARHDNGLFPAMHRSTQSDGILHQSFVHIDLPVGRAVCPAVGE